MIPPPDYVLLAQASQRRWPHTRASVALGQAQIESHYGRNMPPRSNNPLGIKEYRKGFLGSAAMTGENKPDGTPYTAKLPFRVFGSLAEAFDFHGRFLSTEPQYAAARAALPDLHRYVTLMSAVYATGPAYGALLWSIIASSGLSKFDVVPVMA